ncbi:MULTISPECIES: hypothetical protein [Kitasatospora]|uniref:Uncharacterized protein n=1 Tax=Kitasatospora cathayae TaxID=3004092 RepID=A0ABY7QEF4_9ACTN|nr:hypothetical protein [Kitasatospora sp. HUAS 3-15]WBP90471.1 hypothetical protein O1G21_34490 [Kitasatospora sp. HUAS 3-15]
MTAHHPTRSGILKSVGGLGAALALGTAGRLASARPAAAAGNGIIDRLRKA